VLAGGLPTLTCITAVRFVCSIGANSVLTKGKKWVSKHIGVCR
jgi:hypothetical protein